MKRAAFRSAFFCISLAAATLAFAMRAQAGELRGILRNNEGVKKLEAGRKVEAYDRFTDALADLPFAGEVHYNLGNSFLENKEFDKAMSEYRQAVKLAPGDSAREKDLRFKALFNAGVAAAEGKKVDEALGLYQQALDTRPESIEAKTNIELLTRQQQGGGEGENQDKKDPKGDQQNKDKKNDGQDNKDQDKKGQDKKEQQSQQPKPKPTPKPFKSEHLDQQDVNKILEELKRQEEQIRARMQREGAKDAPRDKDW